MMTTEELLKKCLKKDTAAWGEFIRRNRGVVERSARYKLKKLGVPIEKVEIHDITQEIFLYIWETGKLANLRASSSLEAWLAIVSINATRDYYKKNILRTIPTISLNTPISFKTKSFTLNDVIPSQMATPEKNLELKDLRTLLDREFVRLKPGQELALKLHVLEKQ